MPRERAKPAVAAVSATTPTRAASVPTAQRMARRGAGKALRLALVIVTVLAMVVGVRAVSFQGGAVSVHDPVTNAPVIADPADDPSWGTPDATGAERTNPPPTPDGRPGHTGHPPAVGGSGGGGGRWRDRRWRGQWWRDRWGTVVAAAAAVVAELVAVVVAGPARAAG